MSYLKDALSKKITPQNQPIPGTNQTPNSAGGYSFPVSEWVQLERFLILGSEGGSYYASEQTLTLSNATAVRACVKSDGLRVVQTIVQISDSGRAPKNDPAIFALAIAASEGDEKTRQAALSALPMVCRTGTHLFHFAQFIDGMRGWGRGLRSAVGNWYRAKDSDALAYQAVKYQQRDGWSHRDLLRLGHPKPESEQKKALYHWITQGSASESVPELILAFERAKRAESAREIVALIQSARLPREAIPTQFLTEKSVWEALLADKMPLTALLRNLATMTRVGLFDDKEQVDSVGARLTDAEGLKKSRVHPIAVLAALKTYAAGHGMRGQNTWTPNAKLIDALDAAFYASFGNVEASGKRWVLALDVSGSMDSGNIAGVPGLTPRAASAAMALITAATESDYQMVAFSAASGGTGGQWGGGESGLTRLTLSSRQRLDDVAKAMSAIPMGGTDCALPMVWAKKNNVKADAFVVYTDSETWHGKLHPVQALRDYREATGIAARLIVVGMVANKFSIADPNDAGMLDVVGFDTATPNLMADFVRS
jgi:60 kDa SS-A/Ro ribonucleoprotein